MEDRAPAQRVGGRCAAKRLALRFAGALPAPLMREKMRMEMRSIKRMMGVWFTAMVLRRVRATLYVTRAPVLEPFAIRSVSKLRSLAAMRERAEVASLPAVSVLDAADVLEVVALAPPAFPASGGGGGGYAGCACFSCYRKLD